ncbi:DUF2878 domain-containing protein [Bowmanella dokdonensis]|uniref:DUF2878 domain-containing protein n=1 Tax=Bowmanella dokdonensis TaxID=751969 RepID=A0A939DR24_9ALTE|nr:DUF2878 domain-containing protein [Bowmanella dokdonensis]MBN7827108.1 DUF2878 domain-containing protein [Bowmanella dokdonensis]
MKFNAANPWFNVIWFQLCWLVAVLGKNEALWLLGSLLAIHFILVADKKTELLLASVCALPGILVDSLLALSGVFVFSPAPLAPLPLWLAGLWLAFCVTLRHSLSFLQNRLALGALLAAIGGPTSYLAGMKLDAVDFTYGPYVTTAVLALIWAALMPVLLRLNRSIARESGL